MWGAISYGRRTYLVPIQGNLSDVRYVPRTFPHALTLQTPGSLSSMAMPDTTQSRCPQRSEHTCPAVTVEVTGSHPKWYVGWARQTLCQLQREPHNLQQLIKALQDEWTTIPQGVICRLPGSMDSRCCAVLQALWPHTILDFKIVELI